MCFCRFVHSGIVKTCYELDLCDLPWPLYLLVWPGGHRQYPARPWAYPGSPARGFRLPFLTSRCRQRPCCKKSGEIEIQFLVEIYVMYKCAGEHTCIYPSIVWWRLKKNIRDVREKLGKVMSLVAHRFGLVELRNFLLLFSSGKPSSRSIRGTFWQKWFFIACMGQF